MLAWCGLSLLKPPASRRDQLEVEAKFRRHRARRNEVGSAKSGEEIVEGDLVGYVDRRQAQAPFVPVLAE